MASLTIRNIPDDQHSALRVRAAKAGRSMEEEVRLMIAEAVANENRSDDAIRADIEARVARAQAIVREAHGGVLPTGRVDAFIRERREAAERGE